MPNKNNLTKREIVLALHKKHYGAVKQSVLVEIVQDTLNTVQSAIAAGRNVELRNFGVLELQKRKPRVGRNPNKPDEEVLIPLRWVVKFTPGKILKRQIAKLPL